MKKLKNDEIENNSQFEIMFSIKKNTIKRTSIKSERKRNWRVDVIFSRGSVQIKVKENKKKNSDPAPNRTKL